MNKEHDMFWRDGYLDLPSFLSNQELQNLKIDLELAEQKIEKKVV